MDFIMQLFKKYWFILMVIALITVLGGFYYFYNNNMKDKNIESDIYSNETDAIKDDESGNIFVDLKGEIKNQGVYELKQGAIINDAIKLAGGFTKNAYQKNINLSMRLKDEMVIYVFSKSEYKKVNSENIIKTCDSNYNISNCQNSGSSIITANPEIIESSNTASSNSSIISINTATKEELMSLDGIGEAKAQNVIDYRNSNGVFKSIEEIKKVSGFGESIFEKIKDYITV